jgi:hypothetical protein
MHFGVEKRQGLQSKRFFLCGTILCGHHIKNERGTLVDVNVL